MNESLDSTTERPLDGRSETWFSNVGRRFGRVSGLQRLAIGLAIIVAVIALLVPSPFRGRAADAIFDLLHFPAFAGMTWLTLRIVEWCGATRLRHRIMIAGVIALIGGLLEALQAFSGRSPSLHDLVANFAGVTAGWLVFESVRVPLRSRVLRRSVGVLGCLLAVGLGGVVSYTPWQVLRDCRLQSQQFPLLASFENQAELSRWWRRETSMTLAGSLVTEGSRGLRLHIKPGYYPTMVLNSSPQDWAVYRSLRFDVRLPEDSPARSVQLLVNVADGTAGKPRDDAFQRDYMLLPGVDNPIEIATADIALGAADRPVDLTSIVLLECLFSEIDQPIDVDFDHFRLVR